MITVRTATQADAEQFYGGLPCRSFRGVAALDGSTVIGLGGVYEEWGAAFAFMEAREGAAESNRKAVVRCTRAVLDIMQRYDIVYAVRQDSDAAHSFLTHWGFEPLEGSTLYVWRRG